MTTSTKISSEWAERAKWDAYYSRLAPSSEDEITGRFNAQFSRQVQQLLPNGGRVLEAGCGGGWQSLALARTGRFECTLLDFSGEALRYARKNFEREGLRARYVEENLVVPGLPEYDLVFNAGVLEHYTFEQQASLIQGMASRSRGYVLALVPNARCYWYWIWRVGRASRGEWWWGNEVPRESMGALFKAAGMQLLGEIHVGEDWTESFIRECTGGVPEICEHLTTLHRTALIPIENRAYLVGALATVATDRTAPRVSVPEEQEREASGLRAALADALALHNAAHTSQQLLEKMLVAAESSAGGRMEDLQAEAENLRQEKHALIRTVDALASQIADLQGERRQHSATIAELSAAREEAMNSAERIRGEIDNRAAAVLIEKDLALHRLAEQQRNNDAVQADLQASLERERRLESEVSDLKSQNERLAQTQLAMEKAYGTAADELVAARSAREAAEARAVDLARALEYMQGSLADVTAESTREQESADRTRREAAQVRRSVLLASAAYDDALSRSLAEARKQRAWQIMVAIRKAYTLLMTGSVRDKLAALSVPFQLFSRRKQMAPYDFNFPKVWEYLPDLLRDGDQAGGEDTPVETAAKLDVVILPIFDFEFRFQRPQQIACELARAGHRVFWISPSRFLSPGSPELFDSIQLRENLWEVRVVSSPVSMYVDPLSAACENSIGASLRELYRRLGLAETLVIVQFPFWRRIAAGLRNSFGSRVLYDCMDDWRNWTATPRISEFSLNEERLLSEECDILTATSAELVQRLESETGRSVLRVRNGADYRFFHDSTGPNLLSNLQGPIVGYYGAIADWVAVDLLAEVARIRPQYTFVVIGEVHGCDVSALERLPNVHMLGEKPYRIIPLLLQRFDACVLPFVQNELTRTVDPVKLYEYLSQGKPVVATPLPEVLDYEGLIYIASDAGQFAAQLDRAVAEADPDLVSKRKAFAEANSWPLRVEQITAASAATFPLVSILVVSYNTKEYLRVFLESLTRNTAYPRYEVIIVDNGSSDGSRDLLASYAEKNNRVRLLLLEENLGFAAANNEAARAAEGEYLVFLNPDTVLTWGWLHRLLRPLVTSPAVGMTAPVTNFSGNETRIGTTYRTLSEMEQFARARAFNEFGETRELTMAPLLCAVLPAHIWREAGGLDEQFGIGMFEDDDLCLRIRRAGYRIVCVEDCFIHHFGNGSFRKLAAAEAERRFEKNRRYFESKWGIQWTAHKTRPGVAQPRDSDRMSVAEFFRPGSASLQTPIKSAPLPLVLDGLLPQTCRKGQGINLQPDGSSALVIQCQNATPGTLVCFGQALLRTSYGSSTVLSAILPSDFNLRPGPTVVTLLNEAHQSNSVTFFVEE